MAFFMKIKFWLLVLAVLVLSAISYFTLAAPLKRQNKAQLEALEKRARELRGYIGGDLKNPSTIEQVTRQTEEAAKEVEKVYDLLEERDQVLEKPFADSEGKPITDPGLWLKEYKYRMDNLQERWRKAGVSVRGTAVIEYDFGNSLPRAREIQREQKLYWIQEGLLSAIEELHESQGKIMPVLYNFEFVKGNKGYRLMHPAHGDDDKYHRLHCRLTAAMEFRELPVLLRTLQNSKMNFQIEKVDVDREAPDAKQKNGVIKVEYGDRRPEPTGQMPGAGVPGAGEPQPTGEKAAAPAELAEETLVKVVIRFYLPDYVAPEKD